MASGIREWLGGGGRADGDIVQHTVGNALVLHPKDSISTEAQSVALAVADDAENDIVVLDLGSGMPMSSWESVAGSLPHRRRRGIRLIACGPQHNMAAMAGQWLSERLNRTVIAPDGDLVRGSAGALFVRASTGGGWLRFRPGKPPAWDAKRYPTPLWDRAATEARASSSTGEIEPMPCGVWVRPHQDAATIDEHRELLVSGVPGQIETMTVLLGCPRTAPLSLDDVVRFWRDLDEDSRARARFVQYGALRLPEGEVFGQALADQLGTNIICYTGVPIGRPDRHEIKTVRADGVLGWTPFALELGYAPRAHANSKARRPAVLSHRPPLRWTEEIAGRVYWYAPDAVVEVVQAGLWVRSAEEPVNAERVRGAELDAAGGALIFDDTVEARSARMRELAADLAARLDHGVRDFTSLVAASVLLPGVRAAGQAQAQLTVDQAGGADEVTTVSEMRPPEPVAGVTPLQVEVSVPGAPGPAVSARATVEPPAQVPKFSARATVQPRLPAAEVWTSPDITDDEPTRMFSRASFSLPGTASVPAPLPVEEATVQALRSGTVEYRSLTADPPAVSAPPPMPSKPPLPPPPTVPELPAPPPADPVPITQPAAAPAEPATSQVEEIRVQPVPASRASALLPPSRSLDEERTWLRGSLSREFDALASSVSRIMSEHPGMQGNRGLATADVLTDSVAVRLFLQGGSVAVDAELRSGRKGPHVPFARCVVAGLSRLPSYRGATIFRTSPTAREWEIYRNRRLVTDWGFVTALAVPCAEQAGDTDVLVWSMTGRRTALLEPDGDERIDDRVVFVPGTSFKVLDLREPAGDERGAILLRELGANEIDDDGRVDANRVSFDELATTSLRRSAATWSKADARQRIGSGAAGRFDILPGLDRQTRGEG